MTDMRIVGMSAPSQHEIRLAKRMKSLAAGDVQSIRRTAEGWRNAEVISASVALAGGFISGPDSLAKLDEPLRLIVGLVLAIGFICAVLSVGLAVRASVGWPTWVQAQSPHALENWERGEVGRVARYIRISMRLAGVVAVSIGLVIGALLISPEKRTELTTVTTVDGRVYCVSQMTQEGEDFKLSFGGMQLTVPGKKITAIQEAEKCPD